MRAGRLLVAAGALACGIAVSGVATQAGLKPAESALVTRYVGAIAAHRYAVAFDLLEAPEQRYFQSVANFSSVFQADRLDVVRFRIIGSTRRPPLGAVALVRERVSFYDHAQHALVKADMTVPYGVTAPLRIKDPYHPWRAFAPAGVSGHSAGLRVVVRKLSFFTGRLETILTFANTGPRAVTVLPYGRSVLRDQDGKPYTPLATRLPSLTDPTLYTGLRLPPDAQYTGLMTFVTPGRFVATSLDFSFGPVLVDGGGQPFEIALPRYVVPRLSAVAVARALQRCHGSERTRCMPAT